MTRIRSARIRLARIRSPRIRTVRICSERIPCDRIRHVGAPFLVFSSIIYLNPSLYVYCIVIIDLSLTRILLGCTIPFHLIMFQSSSL